MSLILLGHRGAGKTTLGRLLARRLGWRFADIDELIKAAGGMSIREIFELHGERHFRELEARQLREAIELDNAIIAPGGGAVLRDDTRSLLKSSRHTRVYLHCDPEVLWKRMQSDPSSKDFRPPLTMEGGVSGVRQLLAQREPLYREVMTIELDVSNLSPEDAVARLMQIMHRDGS